MLNDQQAPRPHQRTLHLHRTEITPRQRNGDTLDNLNHIENRMEDHFGSLKTEIARLTCKHLMIESGLWPVAPPRRPLLLEKHIARNLAAFCNISQSFLNYLGYLRLFIRSTNFMRIDWRALLATMAQDHARVLEARASAFPGRN